LAMPLPYQKQHLSIIPVAVHYIFKGLRAAFVFFRSSHYCMDVMSLRNMLQKAFVALRRERNLHHTWDEMSEAKLLSSLLESD
jgi:hypothetical protein